MKGGLFADCYQMGNSNKKVEKHVLSFLLKASAHESNFHALKGIIGNSRTSKRGFSKLFFLFASFTLIVRRVSGFVAYQIPW